MRHADGDGYSKLWESEILEGEVTLHLCPGFATGGDGFGIG